MKLCYLAAIGLLAACGSPQPATDPAALTAVRLAEDLRVADSPVLRQALASPDATLRARAALAMGRIQAPAYAEPLAERARTDTDPKVRQAAFFALGELGLVEGSTPPPAAIQAAESALSDPDITIAAAAVEALGKLAVAGSAAPLTKALADGRPEIRREAAYALFRLRFVPVWRQEAPSPPELPAEAVTELIAALSDAHPEVRRAATYSFSRFGMSPSPGREAVVAGLAARLVDEDEWTRLFAARSLGRAGDPGAATALAVRLGDDSLHVRAEAVSALTALKRSDLLPPDLARDRSFHVRAAAARALADLDTPASLETLRNLQKDLSPTVRGAAVEALGRRLGTGMHAEISGLLNAPAWTDRVAAVRAAAHSGAAALPILERALQDSDRRVQTAAVEAPGSLPGPAADALLTQALAVADLAVRSTAVGALPKRTSMDRLARLQEAYQGSAGVDWIEVREGIVDALVELLESGGLQGAEPAGALGRLHGIAAEDPAPSVRAKARLALARRGEALPPEPPSAAQPSPFLTTRLDRDPVVVMETSKGTIEIRCFHEAAPLHCANFLALVGKRFYDGLTWHRVVSNFVIQGGDPRGDGFGGPGYTLRDEVSPLRFGAGTVGMPKAGKDTGGGQLFITHLPTPHLDGNYTVFGQVIAGLPVLDAIEVGDSIARAYVKP